MSNPVNGNPAFFRVADTEKGNQIYYNGVPMYVLEGILDASAGLVAGQVYSVQVNSATNAQVPLNSVVAYSVLSAPVALVSAGPATVQVLLASAPNSNADAVNLCNAVAYSAVNASQVANVSLSNALVAGSFYVNVAVAGANITAGNLRVQLLLNAPLSNRGKVFPPNSGY